MNTLGGVIAILFAIFLAFLILGGKGTKVWDAITSPA